MAKLQWTKWFPRDWLSDKSVSALSPMARGILIDLLNVMLADHLCGKLSGTREQLARLSRCSPDEFGQALFEIDKTKALRVTIRNEEITLVSRRIEREQKSIEGNALRQKRYREKSKSNAAETDRIKNTELRIKNQDPPNPPPERGDGVGFSDSELGRLEAILSIGVSDEAARRFAKCDSLTDWAIFNAVDECEAATVNSKAGLLVSKLDKLAKLPNNSFKPSNKKICEWAKRGWIREFNGVNVVGCIFLYNDSGVYAGRDGVKGSVAVLNAKAPSTNPIQPAPRETICGVQSGQLNTQAALAGLAAAQRGSVGGAKNLELLGSLPGGMG